MLDPLGKFSPGEEAGGRTTDIRGCDEGSRVAEGGWGTEEEAGAALGGGLRTEEGFALGTVGGRWDQRA